MKNILTAKQVSALSLSLKQQKKSVSLVGGCFDILHIGHIKFLRQAKQMSDILIVLLEADQKIRQLKGDNRPINSQINRAVILSALKSVDYVIMLPFIQKAKDYDQLVLKLKPDVIAITKNDPHASYKKRSAKLVGAKFELITKFLGGYSSSRLINLLN